MSVDFSKNDGLIPVIIQNYRTLEVLMLGYMNEAALEKTKKEKRVTFFSRSKQRLWTKGETSGNYLNVKNIHIDCDQDTLLILAEPMGPTCHTGSNNCFKTTSNKGFIYELEETIAQRIDEKIDDSYVYDLYKRGINKVAQKVGEEAVEVVIEAKDNDDQLFINEATDLVFHLLILLKAKNAKFEDIVDTLKKRAK